MDTAVMIEIPDHGIDLLTQEEVQLDNPTLTPIDIISLDSIFDGITIEIVDNNVQV